MTPNPRRRRPHARPRRRGQALVEFALVVPIFCLLVFAVVDVARYVYNTNALNEAARQAARVGAVSIRGNCSGLNRSQCVQQTAKSTLTTVPISTSDVAVICQRLERDGSMPTTNDAGTSTDNCGGAWRINDMMIVTIRTDFNLVTPLVGQILGTPTMTGQARITVASASGTAN
jgi:Flp pilus assembly protein TadG